jgi:hypothetical protein
MLDLDRSARSDDGRSQQRGHVAYAGSECPRRGSGAGAADASARSNGASARRRAAPSASSDPEQLGDDAEWPERRRQRRELTADAAQVAPEFAAAGAVAHVPSGPRVRPYPPIMRKHQLGADLRACRVAGFDCLNQSDPGADQQRFDRRDGDSEGVGDAGVAHPSKLAHQQRGALLIREPPDVSDQPPERLALIGLSDWVVDGRSKLDALVRWRHRPPQLIDAAVMSHPIEPSAQRQLSVTRAEPRVRAQEHVLHGILGVLPAGQHLPGIREQASSVPIVNCTKCLLVPGSEHRDELLIGAQP